MSAPDSTSPPNSTANAVGCGGLVLPDSRLVYITCHLMSVLYSAAVVAAFIWLAFELRSGWVLWGIALCMRSYKHDFNRTKPRKPSRQNAIGEARADNDAPPKTPTL